MIQFVVVVLVHFLCLFPLQPIQGEETLAFHSLGKVGNKEYFYENETGMTWHGALAACAGAGMELATIDSPDQVAFIQTTIRALGGSFWTAGRDVQEDNRRFIWNPRPDAPAYIPRYDILNAKPMSCLLAGNEGSGDLFYTTDCGISRSFLCQSNVN